MTLPGWDRSGSPFHSGELQLQDRLGLRERQDQLGRRMIRTFMPEQHRTFFRTLPFIIVGSVDDAGQPWTSILFGPPGFVHTPTDRSIRIDAHALPHDPLGAALRPKAPVSFLGLEPPTRRRNRANALVSTIDEAGFSVDVTMSFGNCPKYIHQRMPRPPPADRRGIRAEPLSALTEEARDLIAAADTFFVASYNHRDDPKTIGGVDVNHRGGDRGFVRVDQNVLTIPDFPGNNSFNTFGNFLINPRASLLFIDYVTGDLLQLAGHADLRWAPASKASGRDRAWTFRVDKGHFLRTTGESSLHRS